ncbi:hypothetical protein CLM62_03975 [Streptomyces sp. SA15]|uniref:DUF2180 family protein n=1 Tax=Streptomyces sp. SA15 TaxID=934019 RepID=UPI000BB09CE0|nr:hypothetical protein CLM62_03975 [Streptomyces sp. SA15]
MQCYECLALDRTTPASAVCASCGAALCSEHVSEQGKEIRHLTGMGKATHERRARKFLCPVCSAAEQDSASQQGA